MGVAEGGSCGQAALGDERDLPNSPLGQPPVPAASVLRSLTSRSKASWYESWSLQLLKSGMKYSRISRAESLPVSASKHFQSRIFPNGARLIGNSGACQAL